MTPPSAPNDGFNEIIGAFKSGRTAMIFDTVTAIQSYLAAVGVNDRVPVKVLRDNQVYDLTMTVTPR